MCYLSRAVKHPEFHLKKCFEPFSHCLIPKPAVTLERTNWYNHRHGINRVHTPNLRCLFQKVIQESYNGCFENKLMSYGYILVLRNFDLWSNIIQMEPTCCGWFPCDNKSCVTFASPMPPLPKGFNFFYRNWSLPRREKKM